MTAEAKKFIGSKLLDYGVGVAILSIWLYVDHLDDKVKDDNHKAEISSLKLDIKQNRSELNQFVRNEFNRNIVALERNNGLLARIEVKLN